MNCRATRGEQNEPGRRDCFMQRSQLRISTEEFMKNSTIQLLGLVSVTASLFLFIGCHRPSRVDSRMPLNFSFSDSGDPAALNSVKTAYAGYFVNYSICKCEEQRFVASQEEKHGNISMRQKKPMLVMFGPPMIGGQLRITLRICAEESKVIKLMSGGPMTHQQFMSC